MERYTGLRRRDVVSRIEGALRSSGAEVLGLVDHTTAPFEIAVRTPGGERLDLLCYAFTANKYRQGGRPEDEHRFQVKYGSEFNRYHHLNFDRHRITLMFGVHLELDLFIAVDPRMHNPTWFSRSVEFKTKDLQAAQIKGWHGWERDRSDVRRKEPRPEESLEIETVIAFRPEQFLRYVEFERTASGFDCGLRLLLSDQIEQSLAFDKAQAPRPGAHPLEIQLGLPANDILDVISGAFRLAAAVRGGVAEHHLKQYLLQVPGVRAVHQNRADGEPDFRIEYRQRLFQIECKNVLARKRYGLPAVDFQKTRASRDDHCSRYYTPTHFQVLAACLFPITQQWHFRFASTSWLAEHSNCPGHLSPNVVVRETWPDDVRLVLNELFAS